MPRYRFAWTNLPEAFLAGLAKALNLSGDTAASLHARYGVRPKESFIQDSWPFLRDVWLADDAVARKAIVKQLKSSGLGDEAADVGSADGQLAYLRSCKNSLSLRQAVLVHFLPLGEGDGERPPIVEEAAKAAAGRRPAARQAVPPAAEEGGSEPPSLDEWVEQIIAEAIGQPKVFRDEDGDIPLPFGSALVFVRVKKEEFPTVEIFAPLLQDFKLTPEVYEAVNAINLKLSFARAMVVSEGPLILLQAELPAATLAPDELLFVLQLVSRAADYFDTLLQARFGGEIRFEDLPEGGHTDV